MADGVKVKMSKDYKIGHDAFYNRKGRNKGMPADWLKGWDDAYNSFKSHPDMDSFCTGVE